MVISDYHSAFVAAWARDDVSAAHLHGLRKRKGWKVGRDGDRYRGRSLLFSKPEMAWLRDHHTLPIADYHAAFQAEFDRPEITRQKLLAHRKRQGWSTGRTGRFEPGQESWNKGKPMPFHPNSAATRFRKGNLPHNTHYLGHERVSQDGYVEISVAETNPHTGFERRYVLKHRHLWEQANGPVPEGMALKCLDGDRTNTDPANWKLVPRAILPRLNGRFGREYDTAPAELKPAIMATAELEHRAREIRRSRS